MLDRLMPSVPVRKANSGWFHYRTNRWRFDALFREGPEVAIDRPVYIIGTQNGGLTLLARFLHRHADTISVSGDPYAVIWSQVTRNGVLSRLNIPAERR